MNVTIVNYNSGNISSVINSFKEVATDKVNIEVTSNLKKIKSEGALKKLKGVKIDLQEISLTSSKNIYDVNNVIIGELRSATYSPLFKQVIGIAMIKKPFWKNTQAFKIDINGKTFDGKVCDLPFI